MRRVTRRFGLALVVAAVLLVPAGSPSSHSAIADSASLTIVNYAFVPPAISVPVGSTVTWTNKDDVAHTATSDSSSSVSWDSGLLNPGASYAVTFTVAGTFTYRCTIHPSMTGTIQVVNAPGATATPDPTAAATSSVPNPSAPTATQTPTTVPTATQTATSAPMATAAPTTGPNGKAARKTVSARPRGESFIFNPLSATVKVGTRVTWVNRSVAPHTVTSTTKGWRFNKSLNKQSVTFTFKRAGTYKYHCIFHPGMVGKIVVKK